MTTTKTIKLMATTALILLYSCSLTETTNTTSELKSTTPEEFSESLVNAISKKDFDAFSSLSLTKDEATTLISNSDFDKEKKDSAVKQIEEDTKKMLAGSKKSFDEVIKTGEDNGIIWANVKYKACDYESKKEHGILVMDAKIKLDYKGNTYQITCLRAVKSGNNWRSTGTVVYGAASSCETKECVEARERAKADSIMAVEKAKIDSIAAAEAMAAESQIKSSGRKIISSPTVMEGLPKPPEIKYSLTKSKNKTLSGLFERGSITKDTRKKLIQACNYTNPIVRNTAVKLAGQNPNNYNLGQICDIFDYFYKNWKYVNDPATINYVEYASNTINNNLNGDCDDFAVLICSAILSIGGEARVNYAYNTTSGHAFTEVNIGTNNSGILDYLQKRYKTSEQAWGRKDQITGNLWLNLDWFANHPGGTYFKYTYGTTFYILQNHSENF